MSPKQERPNKQFEVGWGQNGGRYNEDTAGGGT